jgi:heavy metal-binding protein
MSAPVYVCPMHSDVRAAAPGTCPHCHMQLVREGTRFGVLKHVFSPLHIAIMVAVMLAVMAAVMMMK